MKLDNIASQAELQAYADNKRFKSLQSTETVRFTPAPAGGTLFLTWWSWCGMVKARCTKRQAGGWSWSSRTKMTHTGKRVVYL